MGAGVSSSMGSEGDGGAQQKGLGDLPENCIAEVMLHLDPLAICNLAKLSRTFRGAASGDFVWRTKLPINHQYLLEKVADDGDRSVVPTNKEIYARLCRYNPFDGGAKALRLEKSTGTYSIYFRLHLGRPSRRLGRRIYDGGNIHGWDIKPVRFQLWTSDGQHALCQCYLDDRGCWIRYHVGDFMVQSTNTPMKVKFSMKQIDCTHTKGGLCVDSVLIYPKELRPEPVNRNRKD